MNNRKLKKLFKSTFSKSSPLMLQKIKEDCKNIRQYEPTKGQVVETKVERRIPSFNRFALVGALCAVFAVGLTIGNLAPITPTYAEETTIYLDVNPSIEIKVDKNQKVIECNSNNQEGKKVLEKISLKGVEVNTALYAIVGSMYTNGYLNTNTNSILVSVDSKKEIEENLLGSLSESIDKVFENNESMDCSIIAQKIDSNDQLLTEAEELDVSVGKMHLINKLIENSDLYAESNTYELSKMSIHELDVIYQSLSDEAKSEDVITGAPSGFIGKNEALDFVIEQLDNQNQYIDTYDIMAIYHYDVDFNRNIVYFVSLDIKDTDQREYFIIDSSTGEFLSEDIIQDWVEKIYYSK